ncbi:MAG: CPBP family intramembrane metalloprotease [Candidatus Thorarchaeota archaeon]|nr:CPBP family intramembrane metalloprotease [Candidatus Thorarchaeota archaeon]
MYMKEFVAKHNLALFLLLTIPLGWFWWIQMVLGIWPAELIIIPSSLGGLSPILTLWILEKVSADAVGLGNIFETFRTWRQNLPWLVLACFVLPLLITFGNLLSFLLGYETPLTLLNPEPAELGLALFVIIPLTFFPGLITSPLLEEPGWRGFALPKLQAKYGRELGSLFIGSYWWLWHQMSNWYWGIYPSVLSYLAMLGYSFGIDSMFNLSKRNILAAMFAHQSIFIANTYLYITGNDLSKIVILALLWTFVIILRLLERKRKYPEMLEDHSVPLEYQGHS